MKSNPLAAYREVRVKTASPAQIVVMLYDEAVRQCDRALALMEGDQAKNPRNIEKINAALGKTQDIVTELMAGLDFDAGGEIAQDLFALYVWFNRELMESNVEKSEKRVRTVRDQLDSLRGAWAEAATKAQGGGQGQFGVNIAG
ncbi:MAG: flagellar export chaperone FliS [Treponema sp.]|nr:flagellar export chaperone FliS [Treponema sp.]